MKNSRRSDATFRRRTEYDSDLILRYGRKNDTLGQFDYHIAFIDGNSEWSFHSPMRGTHCNDEIFFYRNRHRRFLIREGKSFEDGWIDCSGSWLILVRSRHDVCWNIIAFRFSLCTQTLPMPQTDNEALALVGRFDPQVMLAAKLLSISSEYVFSSGSLFDSGARRKA